jgi:pentatricopeptide repeat protein
LAEIYVKQGNYPKAIEIYEQLMLSNPEKKLFFASRIKYIKLKTQP